MAVDGHKEIVADQNRTTLNKCCEKKDIGLGVFRDIDFPFVPTELRVFGHVDCSECNFLVALTV
jgi:hypothetical protein